MEQIIIDIIDKKAARQYDKLKPAKRNVYRTMLYAGAQVDLNGHTVRTIAAEIGYSESGTSKLVQKWTELMQQGDVTVNLIAVAIQRLPQYKNNTHRKQETSSAIAFNAKTAEMKTRKSPSAIPTSDPANKPKGKYVLGFFITPEDERLRRAAIRSAIRFFQTYGKGVEPRRHGEYYVPGTRPITDEKDDTRWLPLDMAALHCGCKAEKIRSAGQRGTIERRIYKRKVNRNYYEYNIADLDKFILDNHLL